MAGQTNPLLEAALQYAARGWRVFPLHSVWFRGADEAVCTCRRGIECTSKGKHPRIQEGFKGATTSREQVKGWWDKWPQANVGIATGGGLTVLDIDGSKGREELIALMAAHPGEPLGGTLAQRTGNGGHLLWALDGARSSAKGNLHVRGEGGYVVASPSVHWSGRHYEWVNAATVLAPPAWLAEWLLAGGGEAGAKGAAGARREVVHSSNGDARGLMSLGPPPAWLANRGANAGAAGGRRDALAGRSIAKEAGNLMPWSAHEEARLRSALSAIPPSIDGQTWASIGRALHDLEWVETSREDAGFELWAEWSRESQGRGDGLGLYKGQEDLEKRWASFERPGGGASFTVASVFHLAKERGWRGDSVSLVSGGAPTGGGGANGHSFDFAKSFNSSGQAAGFAGGSGNDGAGLAGGGPIFVDLDKNGQPKATATNAALAIEGLGVSCRKDVFHEKMLVGGHVIEKWAGDLSDDAIQMLRRITKSSYGFDPGERNCRDASVQLCLENQFNPVVEYLGGLTWDGVRRIDTWMPILMGAPKTALVDAIGRLMLIAAVRRARKPGTKFDQIIVLEGKEGTGKSTAVKILAGEENFSDQNILAASDREQQEAFCGVWIHEIAELAGMRRTDVEKIKQFASRTEDRARPAYGRIRVDMKRRGIFVATTNEDSYLKSETGNRRFWPVVTGEVHLEGLRFHRDQLWAEAAYEESQGASIALDTALWKVAAQEQADRVDGDGWQELFERVIATKKGIETFTLTDVLTDGAMGLNASQLNQTAMNRAAKIMHKIGFEKFRATESDGSRRWKYRRKP